MRCVTASLFAAFLVATNFLSGFLPAQAETKTAIFAGGCFWCVESDFDNVKGVSEVVSGYIGGESTNPTYQNHKGFVEAAQITYDPAIVSYASLVDTLLRTIDPTDAGGQFCDRGPSYTTAIFTSDPGEKQIALEAIKAGEAVLQQPIVTPVRDATPFYNAEDYHQDYYHKNPVRYNYYRWGCGRDDRIKALWGEQAFQGVSGEH